MAIVAPLTIASVARARSLRWPYRWNEISPAMIVGVSSGSNENSGGESGNQCRPVDLPYEYSVYPEGRPSGNRSVTIQTDRRKDPGKYPPQVRTCGIYDGPHPVPTIECCVVSRQGEEDETSKSEEQV